MASQRLSSIRTRIKTVLGVSREVKKLFVKDYHPLEQGLRPLSSFSIRSNELGQRLSSIRTRIKTTCFSVFPKSRKRQRLSSIRTRIKTTVLNMKTVFSPVKDYHPLEQGLRQTRHLHYDEECYPVKDYHPLEQGLRPDRSQTVRYSRPRQRLSSIRTRIKTALTHSLLQHPFTVKDYHPLEQGLRQ